MMSEDHLNAHHLQLRVYYEDTDAGGIVYHANYLKFLERARTEFLIEKGLSLTKIKADFGLLFVVKSFEIEYMRPAKLEDRLDVFSKLAKIGAASLIFEQSIFKEKDLLCSAKILLAAINSELKPFAIPKILKQELQCEC